MVRVGIVGADVGVAKVQEVAAALPGVKAVPLAYALEDEVPDLVSAAVRRIDVALFCGPVPYHLARSAIPPHLPVTHIPYDGSGLVKALFDFHRLPPEGPAAFSIDSVPRSLVLYGVQEVELDVRDVFSVGEGDLLTREVIVRAHERLWRQRRIRAAITYLRSVQRALQDRAVRTIYVQPLASAIRIALERAMLLAENRSNEAAQLVVVLVRVPGANGEAERLLLEVGQETDAALLPLEPDLYALYTTKAGLDRLGDWPVAGLPFLARLRDALAAVPQAGVGFGGTTREAQGNARRALALAEDADGAAAYAILRTGGVLGPLGTRPAVVREARVDDLDLLAEARRAAVTAGSLRRVYDYLASFGVLDTEKLAHLLAVSDRTARRVASRLLAAGVVESAGEESVHRRGRPRPLYRLAAPSLDGVRSTHPTPPTTQAPTEAPA